MVLPEWSPSIALLVEDLYEAVFRLLSSLSWSKKREVSLWPLVMLGVIWESTGLLVEVVRNSRGRDVFWNAEELRVFLL